MKRVAVQTESLEKSVQCWSISDAVEKSRRKMIDRRTNAVLLGLFVIATIFCAMPHRNLEIAVVKWLVGNPPQDEEMYPRCPKNVPDAPTKTLLQLLTEYDALSNRIGIDTQGTYQQGLTDEELDSLEKEFDCKLHRDVRDLYRWHNGTPTGTSIYAFPYLVFQPLEYSLQMTRGDFSKLDSRDPDVIEFTDKWIRFRQPWVCLFDDHAGGGFFYDPNRRNESAPFFTTSNDLGSYTFYRSIGNYVEQTMAEMELGIFGNKEGELSTLRDPDRQESGRLHNKFGTVVDNVSP
jgi:cell wall assembly regulator SMI1